MARTIVDSQQELPLDSSTNYRQVPARICFHKNYCWLPARIIANACGWQELLLTLVVVARMNGKNYRRLSARTTVRFQHELSSGSSKNLLS